LTRTYLFKMAITLHGMQAISTKMVMSRLGDVINVAGHRLSTGAMEEVLAAHPDVAECAVIGIHDELKGQLPLGLVALNNGVTTDNEIIVNELIERVRKK